MENIPEKVFIKDENGIYIELTNEEHLRLKRKDKAYKAKKFILVDNCLMEVSKDGYLGFHKQNEDEKYAKVRDKRHKLTLVEEFSELADMDIDADILATLEQKDRIALGKRLATYVSLLDKKDQEIIRAIYIEGLTEQKLADRQGVRQQTIHKKKKRILNKLRSIIILLEGEQNYTKPYIKSS